NRLDRDANSCSLDPAAGSLTLFDFNRNGSLVALAHPESQELDVEIPDPYSGPAQLDLTLKKAKLPIHRPGLRPDRSLLALAQGSRFENGSLLILEVRTGKTIISSPKKVDAVAFSPDGKSIAYTAGPQVFLLDREGTVTHRFMPFNHSHEKARSLAFS